MNKLERRDWWLLVSNLCEKFIKGETVHLSMKNENQHVMGSMIIYLNDTDCAANFRNVMIKNEQNLIDQAFFKKHHSSFTFEKEGLKILIANEEELNEGKKYEFGDIVLSKNEDGNNSMNMFFSKYER